MTNSEAAVKHLDLIENVCAVVVSMLVDETESGVSPEVNEDRVEQFIDISKPLSQRPDDYRKFFIIATTVAAHLDVEALKQQ